MTRKEIIKELKESYLPKMRDSIFNYIEQHRPRWYRLLLKEILENPDDIRDLNNFKGNPLGITGSLKNIVDVTPIIGKIGDLNNKYGQACMNIYVRRIIDYPGGNKGPSRKIKYMAPLTQNLGTQQMLFYDDKETYLSLKMKVKIKNKWTLIYLEKDDIRIIEG